MLKLRRILKSDRNSIVRLLTDDSVRRYLGGPLTIFEADKRANSYIVNSDDKNRVIEFYGEFSGLVTFSKHHEESGTEISYQLLPEFMAQGLAKCALELAFRYIEGDIVAETQVANERSRSLLRKLGFIETRECMRFGELQVIAKLIK